MRWTVTLEKLRACKVWVPTYNRLVRTLQGKPFTTDDFQLETYFKFAYKERIPIKFILDSSNLSDALDACRGLYRHDRDIRLYAVWCARQDAHKMTDPRSLAAIDVAERFANGKASNQELAVAYDAAWEAYDTLCAKEDVDDNTLFAAAAAAYVANKSAWWAAIEVFSTNEVSNATRIGRAREDMFRRMLAGTAPWQSAQ